MAIENINIRVNATSNMSQVRQAMHQAAQGANVLNRSIASLQAQFAAGNMQAIKDYGMLRSAVNNYRQETRIAAELTGQFSTATRNLTAATTTFNEQLSRSKVRLRDVWGKDNMRLMRDAMREQMALNNMMVTGYSKDAFGRISADIITPNIDTIRRTKLFRQELGYMGHVMRSVSEQTLNWGKNVQWAGRQLTVGFSVPISMAMTALSYFGYQLDDQMVRVTKVYGDAEAAYSVTDESIRRMATDTATYVAEQYGIMGKETRDVMGELAATGREGQELQTMTAEVMRASLLGDLETDQALKLLRTLQEAYRLSGAEISKQVNFFNDIENSTSLTMQDIAEGLPRIAGIMQSTGASIEETVVFLTAFKEAGIDVVEGANALKSINFKAIAASPTARNNFFSITGRDMTEMIEKHEGRFLPMMEEIAAIMDNMSQPDKTNLIARVFGIHQGSRAITLLEQLARGSEGMERAWESASKTEEELANTAAKELQNIQESMSNRVDRMLAKAVLTLEQIGTKALEILLPIGEAILGFINWIGQLPDGIQKVVMSLGMLLAAIGPLIMVIGQFGNLLGNVGKFAGSIATLLGNFKILNPAARAAEIIHKNLAAQHLATTSAIKQQTDAMIGLTQAYHNAARVAGTMVPPPPGAMGGMPGAGGAGGGLFAPGVLPMYVEPKRLNANQRMEHNLRMGLPMDFGMTVRSLEKADAAGLKFGRTLTYASGAAMGLSMIFKNELLTNISMAVMAAGSLIPLLSGTKVAGALSGLAGKFTGLGATISKVGSGAMGVLGRLATFITNPVGLAVTGAVAGLVWWWNKHRQEVEATIESYREMRNSAEELANAYGYVKTTPLEMQAADEGEEPALDPDTLMGQRQRIQALKDANDELYQKWITYQETLNENFEESERELEAIRIAMQMGYEARLTGASEEQAIRVAWDTYNTLTDQMLDLPAFEIQVEAALGVDFDEAGLNSLAEAAERNAIMAVERINDILENGVNRRGQASGRVLYSIGEIDRAALETDWKSVIESLKYVTDPIQVQDILDTSGISEMINPVVEEFRRLKEAQLIPEDYTLTDFATKFDEYGYHATELASAMGKNHEELREWMAVSKTAISLLDEQYNLTERVAESDRLAADMISLRSAALREYIPEQIRANIEAEYEAEIRRAEIVGGDEGIEILEKALAAREKALDAEADQMESAYRMEQQANRLADGINKVTAAQLGMADATEEATDEFNEQEEAWKSYRSAMETARDNMISDIRNEASKTQQAERDAMRKRHEGLIKDIEDAYKLEEEAAEAKHEGRLEALKASQERDEKAIDARAEALNAQIEARKKAERDRQEIEREKFQERWEQIAESEKKAQEARRKAEEKVFDDRIAAIENQIELEEEAERRRQAIFDAEKNRIQRLANMYNKNIDLNLAINTGDLDEAARISSDMAATRQQWAMDDASALSADASKERIGRMRGQIDTIEEEKKARLEVLAEIEKAEDKAREKRKKAAEKALREAFERADQEIDMEKKKNDELIKAEREALRKRYDNRQKALQETYEQEKKSLNDRKQADIDAQRETNEVNFAALEERQRTVMDTIDKEIEHLRKTTPMTEQELADLQAKLLKLYGDHNIAVNKDALESVQTRMDDARRTVRSDLKALREERIWEAAGEKITTALIEGGLGMGMTTAEFRKFILEGVLPKRFHSNPQKGRDGKALPGGPARNTYLHSGGIAGRDSSRVGYSGNQHSFSEIPATLLRGEGVLNLRAMRTPGVPEMLDALNKGQNPYPISSSGRVGGNDPRQGDGMGMVGLFTPLMAALTSSALLHQGVISGIEHGIREGLASTGAAGSAGGAFAGVSFDAEQTSNAQKIIQVGKSMGAKQRDIVIAIMTAMQESSLRNLSGGDRDSVGLFQQRPSQGWGTVAQIMDPYYAARQFYSNLFNVKGRDKMPMWEAAQAVQRSAFPRAYAQWEAAARAMFDNLTGRRRSQMKLTERWEEALSDIDILREHSDLGLASVGEAGGRFAGPGLGWKKMWQVVSARFPDAVLTSARRPDAITSSGYKSYHAEGRAIDVVASAVRMMEIFNFLRSTYGSTIHELYYSPANWRQVRQGRPAMPTGVTRAEHFDHVHWAMQNGGWVPGTGRGDKTHALLEPEEFVVKRRPAQMNAPILEAINAGMTFGPNFAGLGPADYARKTAGAYGIDSSQRNEYNIRMTFTGPVNSEVDIEKAVARAIRKREQRRGGVRSI